MNKKFSVGLVLALLTALEAPDAVAQVPQGSFTVELGSMETSYAFRGEKESRAENIELAASKLDGFVLWPNQVISYNDVVGNRTHKNGFQKAPVIISGDLVEGIGGGVCQVAGTLHAAMFLSALEIVESTQHSRTSTYITPGLDSTVFWGSKDLKVKNGYKFPIKIVISNYRDAKRGRLKIVIMGMEKSFDTEVENIVHYKSKVGLTKIVNPTFKPGQRHVVEVGTPAMDITRVRRIYRHGTKDLIVQEEKRIWYDASKRVIEVAEGE